MGNLNHDTYQLISLLGQAGYNAACSYFTYKEICRIGCGIALLALLRLIDYC